MSRASRILLLVVLALTSLTAWVALAGASGSESKKATDSSSTLYDEGLKLAEKGDYSAALQKFEKAAAENANDPDILNMLAYTLRKTGNLEKAFATYEKALAQRERFPQAREYLAEAHIQAALDQAALLQSYGDEGGDQLASLAEALRQALAEVAAHVPATARPGRKW